MSRSVARAAAMRHGAVAEAIRAKDPEQYSRTCDCGEPKEFTAEACDRCTYLDGGKIGRGNGCSNAAEVIAALRGTDGLSIPDILRELGRSPTRGGAYRGIHRTLQAMLRSGRVRRYWREGEPTVIVAEPFGNDRRPRCGAGGGCWVYQLWGAP